MVNLKNKILSICFILVFIAVEFFHVFQLDTFSPYGVYFFEIAWVVFSYVFIRNYELVKKIRALDVATLISLGVLGYITHAFARFNHFVVPFDFGNAEVLLFLTLLGPILEELIFRGALWAWLQQWAKNKIFLILCTSVLFSLFHFQVISAVPEEYKSFIYYQSAYTLVLAIILGALRMNSGLLFAILGHALYNWGFWLGR